jgi:AcrR family transcriptional regulator
LTGRRHQVNTVNIETRDRILAEARDLFLERGLEGFSMRVLGERVGISAPAIYRHFEDKDALLATLIDSSFSAFSSYLGRALSGTTPLERFRRSGEAYFAFALENPRAYRLMFLTDCRELGLVRISQEIDERARGTFLFLVDRIRECIDAGVFAPGDPTAVALWVWSQVHGLSSLWLLGQLDGKLDLDGFQKTAAEGLDRLEIALRSRETALRR